MTSSYTALTYKIPQLFCLIIWFSCINAFAQQLSTNDYIVTISGDTIFGTVKKVNFYGADRIKITTQGGKKKYKLKQIKEVTAQGDRFTRMSYTSKKNIAETVYVGTLVKPILENGKIKIYQNKYSKFLISRHFIFKKRHLKYYANNFPETKAYLKQKNNSDSLLPFINRYNVFSEQNPESKSYAEKNLHFKKLFNPQIAINFTGVKPSNGYLGVELGLSEMLTINMRLSSILVARDSLHNYLRLAPYAEIGAKTYFLNNNRIKREISTFGYSGWNFSFTYMHPLSPDYVRAMRLELGNKSVAFSKLYLDYYIGAVYIIENEQLGLWTSIGLGYSF